jgi:hypothetical protein
MKIEKKTKQAQHLALLCLECLSHLLVATDAIHAVSGWHVTMLGQSSSPSFAVGNRIILLP